MVDANLISNWRRALKAELQTAWPDAEVLDGRRTGVSRDKVRIAVFFDGYREEAGRVVVARPVMVVRFWPDRSLIPEATPTDPTQLEQAAFDLMTLMQERMKEIELAVPDLWYFRVESVTIDEDPDEWGVEARLMGFAKNVAEVA